MKRVFIGHRGVGKTELLARHQIYFPHIHHFDLDREIESHLKMTLVDFFKSFTEVEFRLLEVEIYNKIIKENEEYVISLGAGFQLDKLSNKPEVFYVSRPTDADGRIFLNRPRLNNAVFPLEESQLLFQQREIIYRRHAHFIYHLSEGSNSVNEFEAAIMKSEFKILEAYYTLNSRDLDQIETRLKCFSKVELRTDLFSKEVIQDLIKKYPKHHWLVSFRTNDEVDLPKSVEIDFDIQFFKDQKTDILSSHDDQIENGISQLRGLDHFHTKLCPLVNNFEELRKGHAWQSENPRNRSFIPRSLTGKWNWYRLLSKYSQKVHFIRNHNDQPDQATLRQWLNLPPLRPEKWAAVLGSPIHFSRSPAEHEAYFKSKKSFMGGLEIEIDELEDVFRWLLDLGLCYVAITSPLKGIALRFCTNLTKEATELHAVNTLLILNGNIIGHNTDLSGFQKQISRLMLNNLQIAVWGGGGTLKMIKKLLPSASFFSSRSALNRDPKLISSQNYEVLVWAAPRNLRTLLPPSKWPIQKIIDLNYRENSMGLEYAQKLILNGHNVEYISGLEMFHEQALKQQEFWSSK